jgi:hypothetical protein
MERSLDDFLQASIRPPQQETNGPGDLIVRLLTRIALAACCAFWFALP